MISKAKKRSRCHEESAGKIDTLCTFRKKSNPLKKKPSLSSSLCADNVYRKCLANGTWAQKGNYSMCHAIIEEVSVCVCATMKNFY